MEHARHERFGCFCRFVETMADLPKWPRMAHPGPTSAARGTKLQGCMSMASLELFRKNLHDALNVHGQFCQLGCSVGFLFFWFSVLLVCSCSVV